MSRIFGGIGQVAYVTRSLEKSLGFFVDTLGIGPWFIKERATVSDLTYRGRPSQVEFSFALANSGQLQLELVQQLNDEPSVYRDFMSALGDDLHSQHVAFRRRDYSRAKQEAAARGLELMQEGCGPAGAFCYVAHPAAPLFGIEISELTAKKERLFESIAQAASGWDGQDPFRKLG